jgi:hypothetical protein
LNLLLTQFEESCYLQGKGQKKLCEAPTENNDNLKKERSLFSNAEKKAECHTIEEKIQVVPITST